METSIVIMQLILTHQYVWCLMLGSYASTKQEMFHPTQTSDAERIGVDQVAKIMPSGKASGSEQCESTLAHCVLIIIRSITLVGASTHTGKCNLDTHITTTSHT